MDDRADDRVFAALFRLMAARLPGVEVALYAAADGRMRCAGATGGVVRQGAPTDEWRPIDPRLGTVLERGACARIDPAALGRSARFCAAQPLLGASGAAIGLLVVSDTRPRRLGPGLVVALSDAAQIAAALLAATLRPPRTASDSAARAPLRQAARRREAAHRTIERARARADAAWSLLLLDLDRFLAVDAALDGAAGDALLTEIGTRLERRLAPGDRLARLDGDRFVVLTARPRDAVPDFAVGLLAASRQPLALLGSPLAVRASVGVAVDLDARTPTPAALVQAEQALRTAKLEGGDRFAVHEPARAGPAPGDGGLEDDLARAAERGQLRLAFQAYVDLADGRPSGAEALLRWRHPTRGELPPAAFIPLAEATGLILPLGAWALRAALAAAARWPPRLAVSVNVSAAQFHQPGFVAEIEAALAASGVAPERLELEITETVLMRDNPETRAQLDALIARGVRIALDDFGTGYSALAYLGRLPHHRIKLDRAFVEDFGNPATLELVRAILALARKTGVAVTAEGVERPEQLRMVRRLGFTHAQGFATGPPLDDPADLTALPLPAL